MIPIPRDFLEFLKLLGRHRVKYLVVGGYSVAYHGYPKDLADVEVLEKNRKRPKRTGRRN